MLFCSWVTPFINSALHRSRVRTPSTRFGLMFCQPIKFYVHLCLQNVHKHKHTHTFNSLDRCRSVETCFHFSKLLISWNMLQYICNCVVKEYNMKDYSDGEWFYGSLYSNEISRHDYHCLDNRDKLPAFSFVCRLNGLVGVWISLTGSKSLFPSTLANIPLFFFFFSVCKKRTANRGYLTFSCTRCPACHPERSLRELGEDPQHVGIWREKTRICSFRNIL